MYARFDGNDADSGAPEPSPLVICDRLLSLAKDADRAGLPVTAEHLLFLAHHIFDPGAA